MTPQTHIFMFRSIIDLQNEVGNGNVLKGKERDTCLQVNFDGIGRAIFRNKFFPNSRHEKLTEENATTFDETDPMHQVNVKEPMIECSYCKSWFHQRCETGDFESHQWKCKDCLRRAQNVSPPNTRKRVTFNLQCSPIKSRKRT